MLSGARKNKFARKAVKRLKGCVSPLLYPTRIVILKASLRRQRIVSLSLQTHIHRQPKTRKRQHWLLIITLIPAGRHICPTAMPTLAASFAGSAQVFCVFAVFSPAAASEVVADCDEVAF